MPGNDKQYYIYLRSTKERVPCTSERNPGKRILFFREKSGPLCRLTSSI